MSGAPAAERLAAAELEAAVEQVSPKDFAEGLKAVARRLPVAAGVEEPAQPRGCAWLFVARRRLAHGRREPDRHDHRRMPNGAPAERGAKRANPVVRRGNRPETQGRRPPAGDPRGSRAAGGAREPGCAGRGAKPDGQAPAAARAQHPRALQRGSVGDRDRRHLRQLATHRPHSREKRLPTTRHRLARGGRACE